MDDKADLVRLAFRVRALSVELEEMERLLDEVITPGIRHASSALQSMQAQLRELAGVERVDVQAAARAVDDLGWASGDTDPAIDDAGRAAGDADLYRPI